jgi:hypothetical protein
VVLDLLFGCATAGIEARQPQVLSRTHEPMGDQGPIESMNRPESIVPMND